MALSPGEERVSEQQYAIGPPRDTDVTTMTTALLSLRSAARTGAALAEIDDAGRQLRWPVVSALGSVGLTVKEEGGHWDATWIDLVWAPGEVQRAAGLAGGERGSMRQVSLRVSLTKHRQAWEHPPRLAFSGVSSAQPRRAADLEAAQAVGRALAWVAIGYVLPTWLAPPLPEAGQPNDNVLEKRVRYRCPDTGKLWRMLPGGAWVWENELFQEAEVFLCPTTGQRWRFAQDDWAWERDLEDL